MNLALRNEIVNTVTFFCKVHGYQKVHRIKVAEAISKEHKYQKGYSIFSITREMEYMTENGKQLGGLRRLGRGYYGI